MKSESCPSRKDVSDDSISQSREVFKENSDTLKEKKKKSINFFNGRR